ncbi:MAG: DNA-binding response regulator [Candidatus Buchananbacteria bacterium RBG_13_36_9]|uniref:DNA-binding response regulator n=1 Tax=Candidatus Buchananbacteria bacterium RBG_13_36_9 TaxID=1797530 RepID=A0A1G1XNM1_9BACT|nr:MAG: DNA-binding response regulator [Candidatus Buchananbacteria bacterium RBG_13_36_9]
MKILIIEDEKEIASFIKKGLQAEHFAVDVAPNGKEGIYCALTNDYDLVILDLRLPDIYGLEVFKKIRETKEDLSIIILTVENEVKKKVEAFDLGANDYLTKPFAIEELTARIRALLNRSKENITGNILKVADLEMNVKTHEVKRGDKMIDLRHREFDLLQYLMRNVGIVLTRSMILEHVWDMNVDPFTNTVDVHMRYLRKKIDDDFKKKLLKTVHGSGYKISED